MPSPFPGMDPYIEGQCWKDFHNRVLVAIADALAPQVHPRYVVRIDERVYFQPPSEEHGSFIEPDVFLLPRGNAEPQAGGGVGTAVSVAVNSVTVPLPIPLREREGYLTLRDRETKAVITVIEVLSPSNKRAGSKGRQVYLRKRGGVLASATHLVELDLLRGGARLPTLKPVPPADYYAFVSRTDERPNAEVFLWSLRQPLPTLPIPLDEDEAHLELQTLFSGLYERAGYDVGLNYRQPLDPALKDTDVEWVRDRLESWAALRSGATSAP